MSDLLLIDLSALVHAQWHVSTDDPNPDATSLKTVERVRALASGVPYVAIACDSPTPSFRKDIDPNYKANRKAEDRAPLYFQMRKAIETLKGDGFICYDVPRFEADDIIATLCKQAFANSRVTTIDRVVIATSDKDLASLVMGDGAGDIKPIVLKSLKDGTLIDVDGVKAKFGVPPSMIVDWLTLVGDTSDNVPGCDSIGPKWAAALLLEFGSIHAVYAAIDKGATPTITPSRRTKLVEFRAQWPISRSLIQLNFEAPIDIAPVFAPRVSADDVVIFADEPQHDLLNNGTARGDMKNRPDQDTIAAAREGLGALFTPPTPEEAKADIDAIMPPTESIRAAVERGRVAAEKVEQAHKPDGYAPGALMKTPAREPDGIDYERQLEPRNLEQAYKVAETLFQSRLFSAYGNAAGVLSTVLSGREFGLPVMASLRAFHIIGSKPTMSADMMRALVLRSGKATYFRIVERTNERATFATLRHGDEEPVSLTFTLEEGRAAFAGDEKAWKASGWGKYPASMCAARAGSMLARLVYPDVVGGLYSPEEMQ